MASFEPSYTALKNLRQKIYDSTTTTVTLPLRPENPADLHPYLDSAIVTLSTSTAYLYDDNAPWAVGVVEVKKGVEGVDTKVDTVDAKVDKVDAKLDDVKTTLEGQIDDVKTTLEGQIDDVRTQVVDVRTQVEDVKTQVEDVKTQMKNLTTQVDDLKTVVSNGTAVQLNSLRKWLNDPIAPISALIQSKGSWRYTVPKGFPKTIRDFWKLPQDLPTLAKLAEYYSVEGWDEWKMESSQDSSTTHYLELKHAVTAHPEKCLMALAMKWGLQYSSLTRNGRLERLANFGKRKAETDNGSRRVRPKDGQESNSAAESTSSQNDDDDDQRSQPSRVISAQPPVPSSPEGRYGGLIYQIIAAVDREARHQNHQYTPRDSPKEPSEVLGWGTPSSERRRRPRRRSTPSELSRSAPSKELRGSVTSEELRQVGAASSKGGEEG